MTRFMLPAVVVLASVSLARAGECLIASAPAMHRIPDASGTLKDNKKGRMLPVLVDDAGSVSAIQVEFVDLPAPYDVWNGAKLFAKAPVDICENATTTTGNCSYPTFKTSILECTSTPFFTDWNAIGVINIWHEGIIPGAVYNVRMLHQSCSPSEPNNYSQAREMHTAVYGDTVGIGSNEFPVDDAVSIRDALAGLAVFQVTPYRPSKSRTQLRGRCVSFRAEISDVLDSLAAFTGQHYRESPSTLDACDAICEETEYP